MKMVPLASFKLKIAALSEPVRMGIGLGLGFAVTLTLVALVMIVGFSYMAKVYSDLEQIAHVNNVKTDLAHTMKYAQRERAASLYSLALITDAFEKRRGVAAF